MKKRAKRIRKPIAAAPVTPSNIISGCHFQQGVFLKPESVQAMAPLFQALIKQAEANVEHAKALAQTARVFVMQGVNVQPAINLENIRILGLDGMSNG
jgi:hypothetical protein